MNGTCFGTVQFQSYTNNSYLEESDDQVGGAHSCGIDARQDRKPSRNSECNAKGLAAWDGIAGYHVT